MNNPVCIISLAVYDVINSIYVSLSPVLVFNELHFYDLKTY